MDSNKQPRQLRPASHAVHHREDDRDYKATSKAVDEAVDYRQFMPTLKPEHKRLVRFVKIVVAVVVVLGLGFGAYYIGSHVKQKSTTPTKTSKTSVTTHALTSPTKTYASSNQNLTFTYPTGWKVSETTTVITAVSPTTRLVSYDNKSIDGHIILRIRAQNVALTEFNTGSALVVLPSQIMTYASPTSAQEGTAYISFLNYANAKGSGIDGIYVTGNTGFQTGQYATEAEVASVDPVISLTFTGCTNKSCSNTTPLTIETSNWSNASFSRPLLTMLESLSIS